jgi:hypothetical protein
VENERIRELIHILVYEGEQPTKFLQTSTDRLRRLYKSFGNLKGSLRDAFRGRSAVKG